MPFFLPAQRSTQPASASADASPAAAAPLDDDIALGEECADPMLVFRALWDVATGPDTAGLAGYLSSNS